MYNCEQDHINDEDYAPPIDFKESAKKIEDRLRPQYIEGLQRWINTQERTTQ